MRLRRLFEKIRIRSNEIFKKSNYSLFVELVRAKFKVIDHNSVLGFFWSLISPLFTLFAMYLVFNAPFGQDIRAYPFYLLVGIICVNFFVTTTTYIIRLLFFNRDIILNSMISREIFILADTFIPTYKFIIELILCIILSVFYNIFSWKSILLLLPLSISYIVFVLGVGLTISLIYCFAKDIEHIWMIISRLLYFVTPIFYTLDKFSPLTQKIIYWANPLTPFLLSFQQVLIGQNNINIFTYLYCLLLGTTFFIASCFAFMLLESTAVERV